MSSKDVGGVGDATEASFNHCPVYLCVAKVAERQRCQHLEEREAAAVAADGLQRGTVCVEQFVERARANRLLI